MLFENFASNIKILTVLKLSWDFSDADAAPRKFHALSFRVKGNAHYTLPGSEIHSGSGDVLYVPEDVGYHIKAEDEDLYVIHFEMNTLTQDTMEVFHASDYYKMKGLFVACYEEWNKKEPGYDLKVMSIFFHILQLMSTSSIDKFANPDYQKIKPAVDYIHTHFKEIDLSVPDLCKLVNMSDTYFRKIFYRFYETTPIKYMNCLRIAYAKELIESGYYTIEQIAYETGFESAKYFSTVFKGIAGCTPSAYKSSWNS